MYDIHYYTRLAQKQERQERLYAEAKVAARLLVWDEMMRVVDPANRSLLRRVYNRLA